MRFIVRRLTGDDAASYRAIRLESLQLHPAAYAATYDSTAAKPDEYWREAAERLALFGAFAGDDLVGLAGYFRSPGEKERHRGWLVQMYVQDHMRGTGCAMALLNAILVLARTEVLELHLGVWDENPAAIRFYEKAGFHIFATDPRAYHWDGRFWGDHSMVRYFDQGTGKDDK